MTGNVGAGLRSRAPEAGSIGSKGRDDPFEFGPGLRICGAVIIAIGHADVSRLDTIGAAMSVARVAEVTGDIHILDRRLGRGDHLLGDGMDMLIVMTGLIHRIGVGTIRPEGAIQVIAVTGSTRATRRRSTSDIDDILWRCPGRRREGEGVEESMTAGRGCVIAGLSMAAGAIPARLRGVGPPVEGVSGTAAGEVNLVIAVMASGCRVAVAILTLVGAGVGMAVAFVFSSATP